MRRIKFGLAFRPTLDSLGITRDAGARAAVGRMVTHLASADRLPGVPDLRVSVFLMPEPDHEVLAYSRQVFGRALWLVYQFDDEELVALAVTDRAPRTAPGV